MRHLLIARQLGLIHHQHDDGTKYRLGIGIVQMCQRCLQSRHTDREAGGRHFLAGEAGNKIIVTPAAADRTEAYRFAVIAGDFEGQFGFEHGSGIVIEATDDGIINAYAIFLVPGGLHKAINRA